MTNSSPKPYQTAQSSRSVVQHLRSEELLGELGREQPAGPHRLREAHQIVRGDLGSAVRGPDRRVAEDVLLPPGPVPGGVEHRVPSLGDVGHRLPTVEETRRGHAGAAEHGAADMVPVVGAGDRLDRQADQDVADVAVPTPRARREHRRLVDELGQPVPGLDHRVARPVGPQRLVVLAGFLVGVIGDAGRVREQMAQRHRRRDRRAGQVDDLDDRQVQAQTPLIDQLQRCHRREQLRDRRGIEPGSQRDRHRPPAGGPAIRSREHRRLAAPDQHHPGEQIAGGTRPQPPIQPGERHDQSVATPRGSQPAPERLAPCPGGTRRGRRRGGRPARRHGHAGTRQRPAMQEDLHGADLSCQ